jgi:K+-transporting ATPase A subunit
MGLDILQMVIVLAILFALVFPVGTYMAAVFMRRKTWIDPVRSTRTWPCGPV